MNATSESPLARLPQPASAAANTEDEGYARFCRFLEIACGITLGDNKAYLVRSRLSRIMQEIEAPNLSVLVDRLERNASPALRVRVVDAMTTNETLWFRDVHPFDILKETLLPEYSGPRTSPVRIWSAACSSGQEPYSISMCVSEFLATRPGALPAGVEIVGTDISPSMLKQAAAGVYDDMELARGLSSERRTRHFVQTGHQCRVRDEIRRRVSFRDINLLQSFSALGRYDIVFCRNVLIYFSHQNKCDIIARIARGLQPRGYLFLGGSEPIANYSDEFEMIRAGRGVVYRLKR